jgi:hypothetical protein
LLDKNSSTIFGLDKLGRVIPLNSEIVDWEKPVFTGIEVRRLYEYPSDIRVRGILEDLARVRREKTSFYLLVEQIDFESQDYVDVRIAGAAQIIRLRADSFYDDINRYIDFVARYRPPLEGIKVIDLRQDGQIVTRGKRA